MCHVDDACPRCGRMKMTEYRTSYQCLRCGRLETDPPPWPNRDRRKGERRGAGDRSYKEGMSFNRAAEPVDG